MTPRVAALVGLRRRPRRAGRGRRPCSSRGAVLGPRPESITPDASIDFSAAEIALGDRLARLLVVPGLTSMGVSLALTLALGLTPWGARIAGAVARPLGGGWFWQAMLGGLVLLLIVRLATLPFGAWSESVRRAMGSRHAPGRRGWSTSPRDSG